MLSLALLHFRRAGRRTGRLASYFTLDIAAVVALVCDHFHESSVSWWF